MPDVDATRAADLAADADLLAVVGREAGEIAMRWFRNDPRVWNKAGGSTVSFAGAALS